MKSHILSTVLLFVFSCSAVYSQDAKSPVGAWELGIARTGFSARETGTVFITFNADNTLTGYGLTTGAFTVFTNSGTWQVDAKGNLTGEYTEGLFDDSFDFSFTGKVTTGKKLEMTSTGILGKFKLNGAPMRSLPDISGSWKGTVLQISAISRTFETYQFRSSTQFPGVFEIDGIGTNSIGIFTVSGTAVVTAKGKVTAFKINDFSVSPGVAEETSDTLVGAFRQKQQTIGLLGNNAAGLNVINERIHLSRPEP